MFGALSALGSVVSAVRIKPPNMLLSVLGLVALSYIKRRRRKGGGKRQGHCF